MTDHLTLHRLVADPLNESVRLFDAELESREPFVRELCARISRYRGKMLRPTLLLLTARACGGVRREHAVLAAVVEMVHIATLVHDDVLDAADTRRDAPTIHRMTGNEAAVLLGDYLISHAYHLCSSLESPRAARRIAAATNRVCEGELMQVHRRGDWSLAEGAYIAIIRAKTAELTRAACELGAAFAGADEAIVRAMGDYGDDLGVAFQIVDDLLDLTAEEAEMGKTLGRDADLEKPTLAAIRFMATATEARRRELMALMGEADSGTTERDRRGRIRGLLESAGALGYAHETARRYVASAAGHLACLPESAAREALRTAAGFVLERRR